MKIKTVGIVNGCSGHWHVAAEQAGLKVLWDYEPSWQREVIEHNFGNRYASRILAEEKEIFEQEKPDLICGSPPCTGFSQAAGTGFRPELECNNYVVSFSKIVSKVKPSCFVMEEVKNFCLIENDFFKAYINNIKKDYNYKHDIVNAFDYGAPQNRMRFVIGGCLKTMPWDYQLLFDRFDCFEQYPMKRLKGIKPAQIIIPKKHAKGCWSHLSTPHKRDLRTLKPGIRAPTITGFCTKDILMPGGRYLAWNEASILMGFPKSYDFSFLCKSKQGLAIGRGIPVELAEAMLLNIQKVVKKC